MDIVTLSNTGCLVTTSLAIAEGVGNPHKSVIQLIRQNINDFNEFNPITFEMLKGQPLPQGGFAKPTEYAILNEQHATLLLTFMRNNEIVKAFKKRLVKAFFEMRDELNKRRAFDPDSLSRMDILQMALESETERLRLTQENQHLEIKLQEMRPKADFYDLAADAENTQSVAEVAKSLGIGPINLFRFLKDEKILMQNTMPYQNYLQAGWFRVVQDVIVIGGKSITKPKTLVTGKGVTQIAARLKRVRIA